MTDDPRSAARAHSLRVAMVARRVAPAHGPGGLERHVFELVGHLAGAGIAVDLFAEPPADQPRRARAEHAMPKGVALQWVSAPRLPLGHRKGTVVLDRITNYPRWTRHVARRLVQAGNAWPIVHVHGLAGLGYARLGARRRHGALVMTTHGLEEFRSHIRMKHWLYAPFRRGIRAVAAASAAVVTTDTSLTPLVEQFLDIPAARQVVIPNAIDPDRCRTLGDRERGCELLESMGLGDASLVLLSVGRLESNKGFELMVSALERVASHLPVPWGWVLVGDGPERIPLRQSISRAGLDRNVVLAGGLSDVDLHSLYGVASWYVHPTRYEGSSLTTLEAMAHGLPVVASAAGGLPDKVEHGETGFLVPPGDVEQLAATLRTLADVDARRLGEAGRQRCEARFSWDVVTPQYVALYERLAAEQAGAAGAPSTRP